MDLTSIPFNRPNLIGLEIDHIKEAYKCGQLSGDGCYRCTRDECVAS